MAENESAGFDPAQHVIQLRGKGGQSTDYLPVAARVAWFRRDAPDGQIVTEHIRLDETIAIFRAEVRRIIGGEVKGSSTGYGSETPGDFRDYIEKAEQKSIGRALAALGYGTQFLAGDGPDNPVDSPVEARLIARPEAPPQPMTENTNARIHKVAGDRGIDHDGVRFCGWSLYGAESTKRLTEDEGRSLADWFEKMAPVEMEYLGRLIAAKDGRALATVAEGMKGGGVKNNLLVAVYKRKESAFAATS